MTDITKYIDSSEKEIFRFGTWSIAPTRKFMYVYSIYKYVVAHQCEDQDPWFWGYKTKNPCPDCGEYCPDEIAAVFEMMK